MSEAFSTVFNEVGFAGVRPLSWGNNRFNRFTPFSVGDSNDSYISDITVTHQRVFDFCGINIFSSGNNHVLRTILEGQEPLGINRANITCPQPTIPD